MIQLHNVTKSYDGRKPVVSDVSFRVKKGEFVYLTGPSGAGKTTILRLILCAEAPDLGQILISGRNVSRLRQSEVPNIRRRMGVVFQDYKLIERKTVFENVALSLRILGAAEDSVRKKTAQALKDIGMYHKKDGYPRELSGGEQQRIAIARALVKDPAVLLADEPTGNLDWDITQEMLPLFKDINALGATVVFATHNLELIKLMPKRVLHIDHGKVYE